jgi:DNA-directed RNA polymerase specialized sigma24 family protein
MLNKNANVVIEGQEALTTVDHLLQATNPRQKLNDLQSAVFLQSWAGYSYLKIAEQLDYKYDYIKQVGSRLWQNLSQVLGETVSKRNIQSVLRRHNQNSGT